jgi:glycosyltransferase involved in cell wall biosynthesis
LGLDEETFNIDETARKSIRLKFGVDHIIFGYFGRAIEGKGLHLFLEALSTLKKYNWSILLDNSIRKKNDEYLQKINNLIKQWQLEERVIFFEADHREIADYMNAADIVAVPSITTPSFKEQYGRVAPEAMACGCLVIASNSGTLPELVKGAGWVFGEGNVSELAVLLKEALEIKNLPSLGVISSEYSRKYLGVNAQAKKMMNVFNIYSNRSNPFIVKDR